MMDNNERTYFPPEVVAEVELKTEGLVCISPGPYNSPFSGSGEDW